MYAVERTSDQVVTLRHDGISAGWEQAYLLISDVHFDSPHCKRKLLKRHIDQAVERKAGVLCFGDWFDAMGGKADKRSHKSGARDEDKEDNYFDLLVDHSVDWLQPYADSLVMFGDGNHETSILKHSETDLLERMTRQLGCLHMGYSGFIRWMFVGSKHTTRMGYWHHGFGGGGPATKGMGQSYRLATQAEADIFVKGHIHQVYMTENIIERVNERGTKEERTQTHLQLPTYKEADSFLEQKGGGARPLGGWWLTFYYDHDAPGRIAHRVERAN